MTWHLKNWRRQRILKHASIPEIIWQDVWTRLPFLHGLTQLEIIQLRQWTAIFLHDKKINGAQGLIITEEMGVMIAAQACLLILKLDLDYYHDWLEIIVYPGKFILDHEYTDEHGIVHTVHMIASGESWAAGPVILSWEDVTDTTNKQGYNVVIHEFAHKLDMLNGAANGFPPLHSNMDARAWTAIFSQAFEVFCKQVDKGDTLAIDPYAATSPAEFFAVLSEAFFVKPVEIKHCFPDVYQQLVAFYRQDPAARWPTSTKRR
ncbi:zinc-dependent peptidase [Nitrosomonas communis]|uniref:M90 family metallopeptidase n=1 Tax=Nitrosomonas communis TaxID=44574 RepID=UPI0026F11867|nr:zinc-dependent peptidase [Nitrosomonas communis]MCO6426685.1 zinc-dependent peptidase [Nitrosomonas communis]